MSGTLWNAQPDPGGKLFLPSKSIAQFSNAEQTAGLITPAFTDSMQQQRHWSTYAAWGGLLGAVLYGGVGLYNDLNCPSDDMFCGAYTLVHAAVGGTVGFIGGLLVHLGTRN